MSDFAPACQRLSYCPHLPRDCRVLGDPESLSAAVYMSGVSGRRFSIFDFRFVFYPCTNEELDHNFHNFLL